MSARNHPAAGYAALVLLVVGIGLPASAQLAEEVPPALQDVGIDQQIDAQLPLDLTFTDSNGRKVQLDDYFSSGKPVLLTLVYYECPMLCTLVLDGMLNALEEIDWTPGDEFEIVTVSIDPRESIALARQKKQTYLKALGRPGADQGWHFLTGQEDQVRALADSIGFRYKYLPARKEYAHSAALFVLTPEGRVSRYLMGVRHEPRTLRLSLVEAADGTIGSPVDQFLLYCYQYDETEGRYAPVAMKIMRVGGLLTLVVLGTALVTLWRRDGRKGPTS